MLARQIPVTHRTSPEVLMSTNVLFKQTLGSLKLVQFARHFYFPEAEFVHSEFKLFSGFASAINMTSSGLQLNIDLTHRVMRKTTCRTQMDEIIRKWTERAQKRTTTDDELKSMIAEQLISYFHGQVYLQQIIKELGELMLLI